MDPEVMKDATAANITQNSIWDWNKFRLLLTKIAKFLKQAKENNLKMNEQMYRESTRLSTG